MKSKIGKGNRPFQKNVDVKVQFQRQPVNFQSFLLRPVVKNNKKFPKPWLALDQWDEKNSLLSSIPFQAGLSFYKTLLIKLSV
jgi:hypothetical protein